jgi:riboflavin kinase/FMN adenylyltransferase
VLGERRGGICNIGLRPTVGLPGGRTIETHILDFDQDIYGLDLEIRFRARLRDERRFDSLEALKAQLGADRKMAAGILGG